MLLIFGLDRIPGFEREVFGNPLWHYIASLVFIVLAFYFFKALDWVVRGLFADVGRPARVRS